ncbi:MAG TPA: DUF503 domain-containing protein [Polyangiaceae bacterium]|jgi:uncharacterized protein YlxP (DUF503 family)
MFVGVARVVLQIPGARSLKDRRRVVKSYKDKLFARFRVSVAEVGDVERYQVAELGIAAVSREASHCEQLIDAAIGVAERLESAWVVESQKRIEPYGDHA